MGTAESFELDQDVLPCAFPRRAIPNQIEPACAGMLMPKLQTQVSPRLT